MQITSSSSEILCLFMNSFSLKKTEVTCSQDNASDPSQLKHWLSSKMPALNYSVTHRIRHSCLYCTANGWLEDQVQQFFYNAIRAIENAGPSAFQLQVTMLKTDKI